MRFNWKKFFLVFCTIQCILMLAGCTAAWIGALQAMIPTIEGIVSAVVAFIAALEGKTVSATFTAKVQQWGTNVSNLLSQLTALVQSAAKTVTSTVITQIQAVMAQLSSSFGSILQDTGITDAATTGKLEGFVNLGIAAINAILALIPLALSKLKANASQAELEATDADATATINQAHKLVRSTYHTIVTTETESVPVNSALGTLPKTLA